MLEEELEVVQPMMDAPQKLHIAVPGDFVKETETMEVVTQQVKN